MIRWDDDEPKESKELFHTRVDHAYANFHADIIKVSDVTEVSCDNSLCVARVGDTRYLAYKKHNALMYSRMSVWDGRTDTANRDAEQIDANLPVVLGRFATKITCERGWRRTNCTIWYNQQYQNTLPFSITVPEDYINGRS